MKEINILTVLNTDDFKDNNRTYDNPEGRGRHWNGSVYMITDADKVLKGTNATEGLTIYVKPGDTINWFDTPINQGMRYKKHTTTDTELLIYDMRKSVNWEKALDGLTPGHVSTTSTYVSKPEDKKPVFKSTMGTNGVFTTKVKHGLKDKITIIYHLMVVKLDTSDVDDPKPIGYYTIDPTIIIDPNG
jgi:hypothetical protein